MTRENDYELQEMNAETTWGLFGYTIFYFLFFIFIFLYYIIFKTMNTKKTYFFKLRKTK
jgi:hypothetical protein